MKRARGVALITALLVVALATIAATALLTSANTSLHRAATLRDTEQAWWYGRGVESWVLGILAYDAQHSADHDGYDEAWAQPVDYLPVDEGVVRGRVIDAQGLFNLNNLAVAAQAGPGPRGGGGQAAAGAQVYKRQLQRLIDACDCLETGGDTSEAIVNAVVDWMSPSQGGTGSDGAKDSYYLGLTPPYRSGQRRFSAPSELLAVRGVTPALYKAVRPSITALPSTTKVNINTAPIEVLRAICEVGDEGRLEQWVKRVQQDKQATANLNDFYETGCNVGAGAGTGNTIANFIDVKSQYFQMRGEVLVGTGRLALYSLIFRGQGQSPRVVARDSE